MSKKYELMVIISGKISDREVQERFKGLREALGANVTFEEVWGMRNLAYPIKNQSTGHYAVWNFTSDADALRELEAELKHFPDLLRYLLVMVPENYTPITLANVEAGLEKLRAEKAEKRSAKSGQGQSRSERPPVQAPSKPVAAKSAAPVVDKPKAEPVPAAPAVQQEAPEQQPKTPEKKTLDEKLEDIFSDDLDLKL